MAGDSSLREYERKRDFSRTPEPSADGQRNRKRKSRGAGRPRFVIQEHDASTLHYDFRLEIGGTLKSWVIPKGPSTDPRVKRLALPTEDHPLEYAEFEGVIPEDEYGGGTVIIWDQGEFRNIKDGSGDHPKISLEKQLEDGQIEVWLHGEKLQGGYALIRTDGGTKERWLLIKMKDDGADARRNPVSTQPRSVVSGRTIAEVAKQESDATRGEKRAPSS
ncbi:MAG: DNA polymerase ligase N-terminal domain-containing protein [Phycisphaerales bacterium]